MRIEIRSDSVLISGYVNAIERNSKPIRARTGERFIERIRKGAFSNALNRGEDVHALLNHSWSRDLGSTKKGNLKLVEDSIGLRAELETDDPEVIEDARNNDLVGWSFGFEDVAGGVERSVDDETNLPLRKVKDMVLREVSILNRKKNPAYEGTLIMARDDSEIFCAEAFEDEVHTEIREEAKQDEHPEPIDYSYYENMISEMKGAKTNERAD